jgi:hypothetical protein
METLNYLPRSQMPATGLYPEPDESSPHPPPPSNLILSSHRLRLLEVTLCKDRNTNRTLTGRLSWK